MGYIPHERRANLCVIEDIHTRNSLLVSDEAAEKDQSNLKKQVDHTSLIGEKIHEGCNFSFPFCKIRI